MPLNLTQVASLPLALYYSLLNRLVKGLTGRRALEKILIPRNMIVNINLYVGKADK